jgi:hypothetical protein
MYKHAGRFIQALTRRGHQPRGRRWTPLHGRLDKEVEKVTASAKADYDSRKAQPGLVKQQEDDEVG